MSRYPSNCGLLMVVVSAVLAAPARSQEPDQPNLQLPPAAKQLVANAEPGASIFNDQVRRFKFLLEHDVATVEAAEAFIHRYQRPENAKIIGAYPDVQTNSLVVIGPPEAEQAIRETIAQLMVDAQGLGRAMPLAMQLRLLQHERTELLEQMAELEVQEVAAAEEENGPSKAKQLADRRQMFEAKLKVADQQIRIVRKYMARLESVEADPITPRHLRWAVTMLTPPEGRSPDRLLCRPVELPGGLVVMAERHRGPIVVRLESPEQER